MDYIDYEHNLFFIILLIFLFYYFFYDSTKLHSKNRPQAQNDCIFVDEKLKGTQKVWLNEKLNGESK